MSRFLQQNLESSSFKWVDALDISWSSDFPNTIMHQNQLRSLLISDPLGPPETKRVSALGSKA